MPSKKPGFSAPEAIVKLYPPGTPISRGALWRGDMILVHHYHSIAATAIRIGEWLRPRTRPYCFWNHCAIAMSGDTIAEEVARGAVLAPASSLDDTYRAVVHPTSASLIQVDCALAFVRHMLGSRYGYATILGDGIDDLTGLHVVFGVTGREVCSSLAVRAHERMGLIPDMEPSACQPADAARYYGVRTPKPQDRIVPLPLSSRDNRNNRQSGTAA